jgi:adenosylcobinamide-phosphate synthase
MLLLPFLAMAWGLERWQLGAPIAELFGLYLTLGARSLREHALGVHEKLALGQLQQAREAVARMGRRDTHSLDEERVAVATVESVLENGLDATLGALFWFTAAGLPGAVLYRLTNTLDAMWGYRNARYGDFGWAAARLDDALNFIPARLTALSYVLLAADMCAAWQCWHTQARHWKSPNAGPTMAAGAGALHTLLGGPASYHGVVKNRPILGTGDTARPEDIPRAVQLVQRALFVWVGCMLTGGVALA